MSCPGNAAWPATTPTASISSSRAWSRGQAFASASPNMPTKDPNYRILARQRSRFTHYYFYLRDETLGPMMMRVASFFGGLRLRSGVDHRHNDAARPGVKREADLIGVVAGDTQQRRRLLAAHRLDRRLQLLDLPGGVLGVEEHEVVPGVGQERHVDVRSPVVPTTVLPDFMESLMAFIWRRCLPQ